MMSTSSVHVKFLIQCALITHRFIVLQRADIGPCTLVHSVALKQDYEKASKTKDYGFEEEVMVSLRTFIKDCDRKITQAKRRLEENPVAPEIQEKVT